LSIIVVFLSFFYLLLFIIDNNRIIARKTEVKINDLPEKVKNLLKEGIFHCGSSDLPSFLETSHLMGYHWCEDSDKQERVFLMITEFYKTNRNKPQNNRSVATVTVLILRNLTRMGTKWNSLSSPVRHALHQGIEQSAAAITEGEFSEMKEQ
jgi:hypothetical protein